MAKQVDKRHNSEEDNIELGKLREMAKVASIYHRTKEKFQRNPNLSHVVHASLNLTQFINGLVIEIFHHVHHSVIRGLREKDPSIPPVPEERNPLFYVYPICMTASIVFAAIWLFTKIFMEKPEIILAGCFTAAFLMFLMGVMEMKHVDKYIDLTEVSDAELLNHPIFIHNFVMCLLSIFSMTMYLLQGWLVFDYWRSTKEQRNISDVSNDLQVSDSSAATDIIQVLESRQKVSERESKGKEVRGELDPIASFEKFPSLSAIRLPKSVSVEDEPVILYCCFVDCFNYIKHEYFTYRPIHEFQVVHIM
ncbi:uncharacterized protein LOC143185087 [Calliopsis andreniformis]|uniref:uncharacterized protein LOC143185087 n=1 Tax=Calliopsis andreniformis TaxID=337506 RepID=UPI003FCED85A